MEKLMKKKRKEQKGRTEGLMTTKGQEYQKHLKKGKVAATLQD